MLIMSSTMMSSETLPHNNISCPELISSDISDTMVKTFSSASVETDTYTTAATIKLPPFKHRSRSHSTSEDDSVTPQVGFIDPGAQAVTAAPLARPADSHEDEIVVEGAVIPNDASTQTELENAMTSEEADNVVPDQPAAVLELEEEPCDKTGSDCGITCLYFAMQCCDCVVM